MTLQAGKSKSLFRFSIPKSNSTVSNAVRWLVICGLLITTVPTSKSSPLEATSAIPTKKFDYPPAPYNESVCKVIHGTKVCDPYRFLEDPDSNETKTFVAAQNEVTENFIKAYPDRQLISDRLTRMWNYRLYGIPLRQDNKYYFRMNSGQQNQSVMYVKDSLDGEPRVFLDPNKLSSDGTVLMKDGVFSPDGSVYAYYQSISGSDWQTIHLINVTTGEHLSEVLEKVKFFVIQWTHDNKGFFYSWYPESGNGTTKDLNHKLSYHKVGTSQSHDVVVAEFPEYPELTLFGVVSDCGKYLFVSVCQALDGSKMYFSKLSSETDITGKLPLTQLIGEFGFTYDYVTNDGTKAIFRTDKNASNYKLIAIDLNNFEEKEWVDLIPHHPKKVLNAAYAVDSDKFVICYMEDVQDSLGVYSLKTGELLRTLPVNLGSVSDFSGNKRYSEIFYEVESFLTPSIVFRVDLRELEEPKVYHDVKINDFDINLWKTTQIFYPSKDGTRIPMFIVTHKVRGCRIEWILANRSPTLLQGYGGFGISKKPAFNIQLLSFLKYFGGILAIANIRGGGGSNGGLLVGACINQRPDLFGAAIASVGVMDMLRFHKFTIGQAWTSDYGSPNDIKHFENLLKYSPLHNIRPPKNGGQYPATLLLTADHDDRVVPMHSLKYIATLQHEIGNLSQQTNPLMIRIDSNAGHNGGGSKWKKVQEWTDIYSFIAQTLKLELNLE
ncbi:hypothetical protein QAD02_016608 [Eretmocerus hayati]|uniref:Uncharacterized protein n=1 Tax=Eretmocerus hayati TaxID=131215 RepID=A0ACC2PCW7_9HYME|nr:hypothetical protein QAD02_016608 [Eretmocerus hayati]